MQNLPNKKPLGCIHSKRKNPKPRPYEDFMAALGFFLIMVAAFVAWVNF